MPSGFHLVWSGDWDGVREGGKMAMAGELRLPTGTLEHGCAPLCRQLLCATILLISGSHAHLLLQEASSLVATNQY